MHKVLVIAYYFPPMGGVGVLRTLKYVKYLRSFGWDPIVLTANPTQFGLHDTGLLEELPKDLSIIRTKVILPPQKMPWRIREKVSRWILTVDEQVGWLPFAIPAGKRIIKEKNVELIYSTSAPYTDHLIARHVHMITRLPWVADFRDPWIGNANLHFPTQLHRRIIEHLERQIIQEADRVVVVSQPMAEFFTERIPSIPASHLVCLPNGFDADDFEQVQPANRDPIRFTIVYTGSFYAHGLTARCTLEAIKLAIQNEMIPRHALCLKLIGNIGKATHELVTELCLNDVVEEVGFIPHKDSIAYLLSADALLLVLGNSAESKGVYTGKLFEYLAAAKPILCLANGGVASELVIRTNTGWVVPPEDAGRIADKLVEMYQAWQSGTFRIEPDQQLIHAFDRKQLTRQLADIFDELIAARGS